MCYIGLDLELIFLKELKFVMLLILLSVLI